MPLVLVGLLTVINCHITQSVDHASSNVKVMGSNFQGKQELMKQKCNAKCTNVNMALEDLSTYGSLLLYYDVFFCPFKRLVTVCNHFMEKNSSGI